MKRALVVGIDDYPLHPLSACVNDAVSIGQLLKYNADGSPNFDVVSLVSSETEITTSVLREHIERLFTSEADMALLYFAGHGTLSPLTEVSYLVAQDGTRGNWGISLLDLIQMANSAHTKISSTVIILDCCHSGALGESTAADGGGTSTLGRGVTLLTAADRLQGAAEVSELGHGLFTSLLIEALHGGAADVCGNITPASIYGFIDQSLGSWEQRPIYKANVQRFVNIRKVSPKIPLEILRRLPEYFPEPSFCFQLDPSFEPDLDSIPEEYREVPEKKEHERIFSELQQYNRVGLVVPIDAEHMFFAAKNSTGCRLTALGAHYRRLAEQNRII